MSIAGVSALFGLVALSLDGGEKLGSALGIVGQLAYALLSAQIFEAQSWMQTSGEARALIALCGYSADLAKHLHTHRTFSVDSVLVAQGRFRGVPFDSGLSIQDRERTSQAWIAYDRFAAAGAFVNAVTQLAVRVDLGDLEVVSP